MTTDELDQVIIEWAQDGPDQGPQHGLDRALSATRRVDQRPTWTFPARWFPRPLAELGAGVPRPLRVAVLIGLLTVALIAASIALTGSPPRIRTLLGPSADRLVAFQDGDSVVVSRIDGSGRRTLDPELERARAPVFSPDGTRVAVLVPSTADDLGGRLLVVSIDGSAPSVDVGQGREVLPAELPSVAWSPNGEQLAFASLVDGVATIFVAASDGSGATAITDQAAARDLPTWSPDGDWIAVRETDPDGERRRLRRMRPDGSEVEELNMMVAPDSSLSRLRWSPFSEGASYAMGLGYGVPSMAVIDFGFGHMGEMWADGVGGDVDHGVPWSPDGQDLVFLTTTEGVVVADYHPTAPYAGELRMLGPVVDCWVDWSPDGTALYGGSPDGCTGVVVIPLSDPTEAVTLPGSGPGIASWQPLEP